MLEVKLEVFKPYRKQIAVFNVPHIISISETNEIINSCVKGLAVHITADHPTATELRWEYTNIGQGHYIQLEGFYNEN